MNSSYLHKQQTQTVFRMTHTVFYELYI